MIDFALWEYVRTLTTDSVYYGSANNAEAPYHVFYKMEDPERPETLCQEQGGQGRALFMFESFAGGQNSFSSPDHSLKFADDLKRQIAQKKGIISFDGVDYRIWHNRTTAAVPIDRGANEVGFYGGQFSVLLFWEII